MKVAMCINRMGYDIKLYTLAEPAFEMPAYVARVLGYKYAMCVVDVHSFGLVIDMYTACLLNVQVYL